MASRGIYPRYGERNRDPRQRWLGRLLRRVVPRHTFEPLRFELHAARVRLSRSWARRRFRDARDLLVNVGSGRLGRPGWVNVDLFASEGVDCVYDCRQSLPFPEGSVRGIFSEHFFEHVDYTEEAPQFLSECHRVLRPGGVLRLIVPDGELYARAYCADGWSALSAARSLLPGHEDPYLGGSYRTKMELLNVVFRQGHDHKFIYDYETLAMLLGTTGFTAIARATFGESRMPELCLDQEARRSESLYVEASKPGGL